MKRIPVTLGFDNTKVIGYMVLEESAIPTHGNYCFALGGIVEFPTSRIGEIPTTPVEGNFDLVQVGLVSDEQYAKYLKQVGVVK